MNTKLWLLLITSLLSLDAIGQKTKSKDEPDKNIDKYLDDGMKENSRNLLRIRLAPTIGSNFGASVERKLSNRFGIEGGLYLKPGGKGRAETIRNYAFQTDLPDIIKTHFGFGFSVFPKIYYTRNKYINNGYYVGFKLNHYIYKVTIDKTMYDPSQKLNATHSNLGYYIGMHKHITKNITIGTEIGLMVTKDKYKNVNKTYLDIFGVPYKVVRDERAFSVFYMGDASIGFLF